MTDLCIPPTKLSLNALSRPSLRRSLLLPLDVFCSRLLERLLLGRLVLPLSRFRRATLGRPQIRPALVPVFPAIVGFMSA